MDFIIFSAFIKKIHNKLLGLIELILIRLDTKFLLQLRKTAVNKINT